MTKNKEFDTYLSSLYAAFHDELVKWGYYHTNYRPEIEAHMEEWVHEAFVRAMKNPKKIMAHTDPIKWFKKTFDNIMKDYFRHQRRVKEKFGNRVPLDDFLPPADTKSRIDLWAQQFDDRKLLAEILSLLTEEEHAVYQRYFGKKMKIKAVASDLQKKEGAVKSMIQRIRKKSRDHKKIFTK